MRLDSRDKMPSGLCDYLAYYGWHFNKKLCDFAVSRMYKDGLKITPYTKEMLELLLTRYGITLKNCKGYDAVYVINMAKADFLGGALADEDHLIRYVKHYIDDEDGYDGLPMTRYFADLIGSGTVVDWEELI